MADELRTQVQGVDATALEQAVMNGNLAPLTPVQRLAYYRSVCESLGLNPLTKPFEYMTLNGKLVLYARRDCTDQLRSNRKISITITGRDKHGDELYVVTARGTTPDGRCDESIGAVPLKGLAGESLANALMKAETKAKRRVTLSLAGLGWTDESEVGSIADARIVPVDAATGEILEPELIEASAQSGQAHPRQQQPARTQPPASEGKAPTDAQLKRFFAIAQRAGLDSDRARQWVRNRFGCEVELLKTNSRRVNGAWVDSGTYGQACELLESGDWDHYEPSASGDIEDIDIDPDSLDIS